MNRQNRSHRRELTVDSLEDRKLQSVTRPIPTGPLPPSVILPPADHSGLETPVRESAS